MLVDENRLIEHLKELGLDEKGIEEVKKAFRSYQYQPGCHDVEEFYQD